MKNVRIFVLLSVAFAAFSCERLDSPDDSQTNTFGGVITAGGMAQVLSRLPLKPEQIGEVHDAVNSSSDNGYDEEYMMSDLIANPGAGVGSGGEVTKAGGYGQPLRDLLSDYFSDMAATKAGAADAQAYLDALSESDLQIYWPYSEDWDGETFPIITFDPGYGAESNIGYEMSYEDGHLKVVDSVYVDENVALTRPVWVVNSNDDSVFSPTDMFTESSESVPEASPAAESGKTTLILKNFTMLRNYDSWFGGASEFHILLGAADGFKAMDEDDLKKYTPGINDLYIVVRRKYLNKALSSGSILLTDFTESIEKMALLIVEDDGGTTTSWKCSATVKWKSKSWGFELEIPYRDKDDIVWRGQISGDWFRDGKSTHEGRFGDVKVAFELQ